MPIRSESTPETCVNELREIFRWAQQPLGESTGESLDAPSSPEVAESSAPPVTEGDTAADRYTTFSERHYSSPARPSQFTPERSFELESIIQGSFISPMDAQRLRAELEHDNLSSDLIRELDRRIDDRRLRNLTGHQAGNRDPEADAVNAAFDASRESARIHDVANESVNESVGVTVRVAETYRESEEERSVTSVSLPGGWELCLDSEMIDCRELEDMLGPAYVPGRGAPQYVVMTSEGLRFRAYYVTLWSALVAHCHRHFLSYSGARDILKAVVEASANSGEPVDVDVVRQILREGRNRQARENDCDSAERPERVPGPFLDEPCEAPSLRRSERPIDRTDYTPKYRHLFTEKVLRVFKEEGIADEEAIRVLSRMFARGEASTSVLMDGSFIYKYCDNRRFLMNKILNRVAAERASLPQPPPPEVEAEGNDFDPTIDMLTGRPVGL